MDSETPYQQLNDKPNAKVKKPKMSANFASENKKIGQANDDPEEGLFSELIDDGESHEGGASTDSEDIREEANRILELYRERLLKVGQREFQIRLNIFFTFVVSTSVEAEAYDYL